MKAMMIRLCRKGNPRDGWGRVRLRHGRHTAPRLPHRIRPDHHLPSGADASDSCHTQLRHVRTQGGSVSTRLKGPITPAIYLTVTIVQ